MSDHWDAIREWAQHASRFRRLKAYAVCADGSRQPLDGAMIVVELDEDRGLMLSLSERIPGEGVAVCSFATAEKPFVSSQADPAALPTGSVQTSPSRTALIATRSGAANLVYLSPELRCQAGS